MFSFFRKKSLEKPYEGGGVGELPSKFLPRNFQLNHKIVVIAGKGKYPDLTLQRIKSLKIPCGIIGFEDETDLGLYHSFPEGDRVMVKVGQLGHLLDGLKKLEARFAVMAGQITPKRLFNGLQPDLKALLILSKLRERNAESIFGAIAEEMGKIEVPLLDARVFLDSEVATKGWMTSKISVNESYLEHGIRMAKNVAALNIGQGVVVNEGTVLAVEAFEGTDSMIKRAGEFNAPHPIFIKTVKPHQDYRFDVPVFGLRTIESLHEAKINTVLLESDNTLILEKEGVIAQAKKLGIHLLGY